MTRVLTIIRKVSALHSKSGLRAKCEMVIESRGIFINEIYRKFAEVPKVQMEAADLIALSRKLRQS
jgi:hypothetical protein